MPNALNWVDPLGLSPCTSNHAEESNIVYRALTREGAARVASGKSIQGKAINGTGTAAEHVANASINKSLQGGALKNSPWISTTKLKSVAEGYEGEHGIVAIDLDKVSSFKVQVWGHTPRVNGEIGLPYHRSIWAQEVTIFQEIPNSAIIGFL